MPPSLGRDRGLRVVRMPVCRRGMRHRARRSRRDGHGQRDHEEHKCAQDDQRSGTFPNPTLTSHVVPAPAMHRPRRGRGKGKLLDLGNDVFGGHPYNRRSSDGWGRNAKPRSQSSRAVGGGFRDTAGAPSGGVGTDLADQGVMASARKHRIHASPARTVESTWGRVRRPEGGPGGQRLGVISLIWRHDGHDGNPTPVQWVWSWAWPSDADPFPGPVSPGSGFEVASPACAP